MKRLAILDDYQNVALTMADWSLLRDDVSITVFDDHVADEDLLVDRLQSFEIICAMRERTPFPQSLLQRLPKLEHLFTPGMRNASIDLAAARSQGVVVSGSRSVGNPTAELTWALIFALTRHIVAEDNATRAGHWQTTIGTGLDGKTLGIIGLGKVGRQVANVGRALGMTVVAWSPNLTPERCVGTGAEFAGKEFLLRTADIVTIHLQLGDNTRALIGEPDFKLMKRSAYLINTSRGPIVREADLINALQMRTIAGAGLDVFDTEPLAATHALRQIPNTVLTPHIGYVTIENYKEFFGQAIRNIRAWLAGNPVNTLN